MGESEGRRGEAQEAERWQASNGGQPAIGFVGLEVFAQAQQGPKATAVPRRQQPQERQTHYA